MGTRRRRFEALESFVKPRAKLVKQSLCSWRWLWNAIKTSGLVLLFYFFSITLTFYNQKYFHIFKNPLSVTMVHLIVKFVLASCIRCVLTYRTGKERTTLPWSMYIMRIAPPGFASSLDIGLSNWGLEFITISLYTMTKSTSIIFILGFSILFKLERLVFPPNIAHLNDLPIAKCPLGH
ncbi:Solute carrier family 35 member C2 [Lamellibrachia satsuma]|nr:Solute carrier family 35 member C2 [Lamellibrachia satsuma]